MAETAMKVTMVMEMEEGWKSEEETIPAFNRRQNLVNSIDGTNENGEGGRGGE